MNETAYGTPKAGEVRQDRQNATRTVPCEPEVLRSCVVCDLSKTKAEADRCTQIMCPLALPAVLAATASVGRSPQGGEPEGGSVHEDATERSEGTPHLPTPPPNSTRDEIREALEQARLQILYPDHRSKARIANMIGEALDLLATREEEARAEADANLRSQRYWSAEATRATDALATAHHTIAELEARIGALKDERDQSQEALWRIAQWADAYPLKVFPEPDWRKARTLLEAGGMTLDSVSAGAMRRVVEDVGKIAKDALLIKDMDRG